MTMTKTAAGLAFAALLLGSMLAWSQANVDESQETATLYVDASRGSDSNPGTKQLPLKTVGAAATKAVSNNQAGVGTKVIVNPGTYREAITLKISGRDTTLPMTFQAATPGTAIISGADVWTGWNTYSGNSSIFTHAWANKWGLCALDGGASPTEEDIIRRREMIFVNGTPMTQVLSLSAMRQGTLYADETHSTVYVWPPAGTNMATANVEVPTRANLFTINGKSNIVLRGLTFRYANSCRGDAAVPVVFGANNVLVDNSFFNWNNAAGLHMLFTTNTTVQTSVANHNGTSGMKGFETKLDLWQNNQTRYNGWRGTQGVYYAWGTAGTHFGLAHNQTLKNIDSSFNQTFGFHWDTDNENDTADSLVASENLLGGGFIEKSQGPMTVSNSYFCNGNPYTGPNDLGFELRNSTNITLTGNTFLNNMTQLLVIGQVGGIQTSNWETGQQYTLITQNTTFSNNVIDGGTNQQLFTEGALGGLDWTKFKTTLASDFNTWWNATATKVFFVPVPDLWTKVDFAGWQAATGKDAHSAWKAPSNPGVPCRLTPNAADFWFITDAFSGYQTITRGSSASWTANVIPMAFSGTVTLSSDGLQNVPGVTASFSSGTIVNAGTSTFTVTTSVSTPKGTYPITVIANSGSLTKTMTVSLIVQ